MDTAVVGLDLASFGIHEQIPASVGQDVGAVKLRDLLRCFEVFGISRYFFQPQVCLTHSGGVDHHQLMLALRGGGGIVVHDLFVESKEGIGGRQTL